MLDRQPIPVVDHRLYEVIEKGTDALVPTHIIRQGLIIDAIYIAFLLARKRPDKKVTEASGILDKQWEHGIEKLNIDVGVNTTAVLGLSPRISLSKSPVFKAIVSSLDNVRYAEQLTGNIPAVVDTIQNDSRLGLKGIVYPVSLRIIWEINQIGQRERRTRYATLRQLFMGLAKVIEPK